MLLLEATHNGARQWAQSNNHTSQLLHGGQGGMQIWINLIWPGWCPEATCNQDSLPEWSKGVDSSSTSASCVGSNPTAVRF